MRNIANSVSVLMNTHTHTHTRVHTSTCTCTHHTHVRTHTQFSVLLMYVYCIPYVCIVMKEKEREGGRIKRWHRVSCTNTPGQLDTLAHYCYKEQSFPLSYVLVLISDLLLLSLFLLHPRLVNPLLLKVSLRDAGSNIHTQYKCATLNTHTLYVYSRYCPDDTLIDLLHTRSACLHI